MGLPQMFQSLPLAKELDALSDKQEVINRMLSILKEPRFKTSNDLETLRIILYFLSKVGITDAEITRTSGQTEYVVPNLIAGVGITIPSTVFAVITKALITALDARLSNPASVT